MVTARRSPRSRPRRRPRCRRGGARRHGRWREAVYDIADLLEEDLGERMVGFHLRPTPNLAELRTRRGAGRLRGRPFSRGGGVTRRRLPAAPPDPLARRRDATARPGRGAGRRAGQTASLDAELPRLRPLATVGLLGERGRRDPTSGSRFLGDAVLGMVVTDAVLPPLPRAAGGELAKLRSSRQHGDAGRDQSAEIRLGSACGSARAKRRRVGGPRPPSSPTPWKP